MNAERYLVRDSQGFVMGEYDCHEDAVNMMRGWNDAYPAPPYEPFHLDPETCADEECECRG